MHNNSHARPKPLALLILDGWGYREEMADNAIAAAKKPCWDYLWQHYPHTLISGCGHDVGLPEGQMGNSEVGHLNMGAGRVVHQDLTRIDMAIQQGEFFSNPVLMQTILATKQSQNTLHIFGLLSPGGVHSQEAHIHALLTLCAQQQLDKVVVHVFLDGRDTPPRSAMSSIQALVAHMKKLHCGKVVSLIGRYYAMDRDKRWERIQKAYELLAAGIATFHAEDPLIGLQQAYERGESDEFVQATCIHVLDQPAVSMQEGDTVIFMNFRADRAREITQAFIDPYFQEFPRAIWPKLATFVTLTAYDKRFPVPVVFPQQSLQRILGEYLSTLNLRQLRIAETEKYAHVTFFFNGGVEAPYPGEDRVLIPSPKVSTYDLQPEMSAREVTTRLVAAIERHEYDVIICNFANPDMVGHTGNFSATVKAIETVDACLRKIIAALQDVGGEAIITADHGNAELMFDQQTHQLHTAHTEELVPFVYVGRPAKIIKTHGILSDIAPTMLYLLHLAQPTEMTGQSLVELQ
ncbi:MAG: phosphoglycerate mutase (2,3-diphosphoglycerate-independent) [Gammaproteobacteria bacterium RIFCSPHIGHO2_12_FULL_41_20]|nr:MAG: phosphoglycerate mutase (2,3-diphosphoglycerate-independent) [Gammaproteobacteria bacterium RIFCSPHIGHO2_12_FULL_41_20]